MYSWGRNLEVVRMEVSTEVKKDLKSGSVPHIQGITRLRTRHRGGTQR